MQLTHCLPHALSYTNTGDKGQLVDALIKNVYGGDATMRPSAILLSRYLLQQGACLGATPAEAVYKGHMKFAADVVKS